MMKKPEFFINTVRTALLASAAGVPLLLAAAPVQAACTGDMVEWVQLNAHQYLIYGTDNCNGLQSTTLYHNGRATPLNVTLAGEFSVTVDVLNGRNSFTLLRSDGSLEDVASVQHPSDRNGQMAAIPAAATGAADPAWQNSITLNGRSFSADDFRRDSNGVSYQPQQLAAAPAPAGTGQAAFTSSSELSEQQLLDSAYASVGTPAAPSQGDVSAEPLEISPEQALWALSNRIQNFEGENLSSDGTYRRNPAIVSWFRRQNPTQVATAGGAAGTGGAASSGNFLIVELTWQAPVDLDLHIFEPSAAGPRIINSNAPGHIWSKAPRVLGKLAKGQIRELGADRSGGLQREVYSVDLAQTQAFGDYDVHVDYAKRTFSANADPETCGIGSYADITATVTMSSTDFTRSHQVKIPSITCGTPLVPGEILTPVGRVSVQ